MENNHTGDILNNKGQLFRITYQQLDCYFRVLKPVKITASTNEIELLIEEETHTIERDGRLWVFKNSNLDNDFANAIGRLICLRYRL
ncbi:hypothetical protein GCM10023231_19230 [Olivibacter ginsenosidimutans]|uniref:Uncharacterized protein n=1 Tax=Olivibacter ginsenosidimutans TaxID=1176537 RepID=A0ABP9B6V7_9SPHI